MGRSLIVIPAHLSSERLPGKVLLQHKGRSLLEWTYRQALKCFYFADVVVATSDSEIADVVHEFNGNCVYTPGVKFPNGTNRAISAFRRMRDQCGCSHDSLIVWQADEPFLEPNNVCELRSRLFLKGWNICTIVAAMDSLLDLPNPNAVKAVLVTDEQQVAWFTRAPLVYAGIHVGIYAFDANNVSALSELPIPQCANDESLEQLTWLSAGWSVGVVKLETCAPLSINTQDDWERFLQQ